MTDPLAHLSETAKHVFDALSIGGVVAVFLGWVPEVTAVVMLVWGAMRLYECWLSIKLKRRELAGK